MSFFFAVRHTRGTTKLLKKKKKVFCVVVYGISIMTIESR